jgi:glycosyltransferase involved in cell wall biosynthesis
LHGIGIDRAVIESLQGIVLVSLSQLPFFERHNGVASIIPHGVDNDFFTPDANMQVAARVLSVGDWLRDFTLYNQITRLAYELSYGLKFVYVLRRECRNRVAHRPNVTTLDGISDIALRDEYRRASCLLLPLIDSTANNALLEGLACGVPYVISKVGGVSEYVDAEGGALVTHQDPQLWLEAIMEIVDSPCSNVSTRIHCREQAMTYDWRRLAPKFIDCYCAL